MTLARTAEAGAWLLAAGLLAASVIWPGWSAGPARDAARRAAEATLRKVVARERQVLAERGRFVGFGPTEAQRTAALGRLDLGRDGGLFDIDALLDETGSLNVRVLSRPDAVRDGDIVPVIQQIELDPNPPVGSN